MPAKHALNGKKDVPNVDEYKILLRGTSLNLNQLTEKMDVKIQFSIL